MFYGSDSDRYKKLPSCVHKIGLFHNPWLKNDKIS